MMKTSSNGLSLIKEFEGYRDKAYKCSAGIWTCGYGHTTGVNKDTVCSKSQADIWLAEDLRWAETAVNAALPTGLTQNQFDALVSLTFNIGSGNFRSSTLLALAKKNPDDAGIRTQFLRWDKVRQGGTLVSSQGLKNRRIKEANLYFTK